MFTPMEFRHIIVLTEVAVLVCVSVVSVAYALRALWRQQMGFGRKIFRQWRYLYLIMCVIGAYKGLSTGVEDTRRYREFAAQGVQADAKVVHVGHGTGKRGKRYQNFVRYRDVSGKQHHACFVEYSPCTVGETVEVCYLRSAPHTAVRKTKELTSPLFASLGLAAGSSAAGLAFTFLVIIILNRKERK